MMRVTLVLYSSGSVWARLEERSRRTRSRECSSGARVGRQEKAVRAMGRDGPVVLAADGNALPPMSNQLANATHIQSRFAQILLIGIDISLLQKKSRNGTQVINIVLLPEKQIPFQRVYLKGSIPRTSVL
jgi:hypothetical protein